MNLCMCPDHLVPIVVAAGDCMLPTSHFHEDDQKYHDCVLVEDVGEFVPKEYPHTTVIGTKVKDEAEFMQALKIYLPQK